METFKRDLSSAGIEFIDVKGQRADFHSLRHTLEPISPWLAHPACCHGSHATQRYPADHENVY